MSKIELLAPAGSLEALYAAAENGADAVYFGGQMFNARQNAANFTIEEMNEAVSYLHKKGSRSLLTLNTLIGNHEILDLLDYIYEVAACGVDGVIVQDLGVVEILKETLPELSLHASTQMAVHNWQGVKYLEDLGFKRAVLARECSLAEIRKIRESCEIELETFVHGALCVGFSGRCLFSSFIGGRSGNRGLCAQPCRLPYTLLKNGEEVANNGKYLLSPKDLNLIEKLPDLIRAGVNSLKIEGRMKRPEYVATVVGAYRRAIDGYYADNFRVSAQDKADLRQIFNRDFTTGYYYSKQGREMMSYERPDNRGVSLGEVVADDKKRKNVKLSTDLANGDGYLAILPNKNQESGKVQEMRIGAKKAEAAKKGDLAYWEAVKTLPVGSKLYLTAKQSLLAKAQESYKNAGKNTAEELKNVDFYFTAHLGEPLKLMAIAQDGNYAERESEFLAVAAQKHPSDKESVKKQLARLGGSGYALGELEITIDEGLMLPASELNKLRREVLEEIDAQSIALEKEFFAEDYTKEDYLAEAEDFLATIPPQVLGYTTSKISVEVSDLAALKAAADAGADVLIAKWHNFRGKIGFTAEDIQAAVAYAHENKKQVWLSFANLHQGAESEVLKKRMIIAKESGADGVYAADLGGLYLAKEIGIENIAVDYLFNVYNDPAVKFFMDEGVDRVCLSPEMNLQEIGEMSYLGNVPLECIIHGNFPLMMSNYCAIGAIAGKSAQVPCDSASCAKAAYALKDRMNAEFPLLCDENCRMYIYNSKTLNTYKRFAQIAALEMDYLRIMADFQSAEWISAVVNGYKNALTALEKKENMPKTTDEALSDEEATYGHFYRGV